MLSPSAALLIIDMQKGINNPTLGRRNNLRAEDNIASLLKAWRETKQTIIHIRHISRSLGSVFWPGQSGVEFQERFIPLSDEHIVEKNVPDAFAATALERWLRVRSINALVIAGVITNNSIEATARSAGNLGFSVIVAHDACFTFAKTDFSGVLRTAQEVHDMSLANLQDEYASILSTEEILRAHCIATANDNSAAHA